MTPETKRLVRSTKSKITKDENGENMLHLETAVVVLTHCNVINNIYQNKIQESCINLFLINSLVNY